MLVNDFNVGRFKNGFENNAVDADVQGRINNTMNQIDWSKDRIALWVPGTGERGVDGAFARSVARPDTSVAAVDYPADIRFTTGSVGTGTAVLKAVLERAAAEGKDVVIAGHSQGAWVAGEAMADKHASRAVTKAALFGMPSVASHQYESGQDGRVKEINNHDDPYANDIQNGARLVEAASIVARDPGQAFNGEVLDTINRSQGGVGPVAHELVMRGFGGMSHAYNRGSEGAFLNS